MKELTRKEHIHAVFGHRPPNYGLRSLPERPRGTHVVEKLIGTWRPMAHGDAPGGELDRMLRTASALGGRCRIVRRRDGVVVWEGAGSREFEAVRIEAESSQAAE